MSHKKYIRYIYLTAVFFLTVTGFGQMPIFKRYYIADIPGLGWLAKFFTTHYLHYLFGVILLALVAYIITDFFLTLRKKYKITTSGYIRASIIAGLIVSGIIMVIRNFAGYHYSPKFIVVTDLIHLGLVFMFLITGLVCIILKKYWMRGRTGSGSTYLPKEHLG